MRNLPIILLAICIFCSCSLQNKGSKDEVEIQAVTDSFTTKYYCWQFKDAASFSSEDFKRQLQFLSSNMSREDVEILKSGTKFPDIEIDDISISDDEATVKLQLHDIYVIDSIGSLPHLQEEATHQLLLKKENGKWIVTNVRTKEDR